MSNSTKSVQLLKTTVAVAGVPAYNQPSSKTLNAIVAGTGTVSATVNIEGANVDGAWVLLGSISLSGTDAAADGFYYDAPWSMVRANVVAIAGTGAAVTVAMGVPA